MHLSLELAVSMIAALAGLWQVYVAKQAVSKKLLQLDNSQFGGSHLSKKPYSAVDTLRAFKKKVLLSVQQRAEAGGHLKWTHYTAA